MRSCAAPSGDSIEGQIGKSFQEAASETEGRGALALWGQLDYILMDMGGPLAMKILSAVAVAVLLLGNLSPVAAGYAALHRGRYRHWLLSQSPTTLMTPVSMSQGNSWMALIVAAALRLMRRRRPREPVLTRRQSTTPPDPGSSGMLQRPREHAFPKQRLVTTDDTRLSSLRTVVLLI